MKLRNTYYLSQQDINNLLEIFPTDEQFKRIMKVLNVHLKSLNMKDINLQTFQMVIMANAALINTDIIQHERFENFLESFIAEND